MNYYELLNIKTTASSVEIKKSYRKMAMKWHPDRNQNSKESEEIFKKIKEAYETLSNESARFWYDREFLKDNPSSSQNNSSENHSNDSSNSTYSDNSTDKNSSKHEGSNEHTQNNQKDNKDQTFRNDTFDNGEEQSKSSFQDQDSFLKWKTKYPFENLYEYHLDIQEDFIILGGKTSFNYPWKHSFVTINITIPSQFNINNGLDVKITNKDILIVFLKVIDNPNKHLDIYSKIDIDIFSALNGVQVTLSTTSGTHEITIPPMTKNGDSITMLGLGRKGDFFVGNLYIKIFVYYPEFFSDKQKSLLSELSSIQRKRDRNLFSRIFSILKEGYYTIHHPKNN